MTKYKREVFRGGFDKTDKDHGEFTMVEFLTHLVSDLGSDGNWYEREADGLPIFRTGSTEFIYYLGPGLLRSVKNLAALLQVGRRFHRDSPQLNQAYAGIILSRMFQKDEDLVHYGLGLLTRDDEAVADESEHCEIRGTLMLLLTEFLPIDEETETVLRRIPWRQFLEIIADYLEGNHLEALEALLSL